MIEWSQFWNGHMWKLVIGYYFFLSFIFVSAVAFGDPHIITFDGLPYRFHGRGEFTIVQADSFVLQGRFSEPALSSRKYH